jgi:SAM-dependent methyltransferase
VAGGWEQEGGRLAARSLAEGDPTRWFDEMYAAGASGRVSMPWNRTEAHPLLSEWAEAHGLTGKRRRAVVVGCGLGADAEYIAGLGFDTVGFDISETAIEIARERTPGSEVDYVTADLLEPPDQWIRAFDLVVEIIAVQALPDPQRRQAIFNVGRMVAPRGTLLAIAAVRDDDAPADPSPPWPLGRDEVEAFADDGLRPIEIELAATPDRPEHPRWRAHFERP